MTWLVRRTAVLLALALCFSMVTGSAEAQTPAAKARARELYTKGQQLFRQGSYGEAQRSFEDAYTAVPNPIVLLSIAECQVRSEQIGPAVGTLRRYLDERKDAPDRAQVEAQIDKLERRPALLSVQSTPAGALIFVDGADTAKLTPSDVELPPGEHRVAVQIEGFQRAEQVVTVGPGEKQAMNLALPEVAAPVEPAVPAVATQSEAPRARSLTPVWVATGVAGAGLVTGILCGSLALKESKDFDDTPTEGKADKGEKLALFADVGFGVAVAGGVTALVLYLTADDDAPAADAPAVSVAPTASRHEVGLTGSYRF